jgi:hypothetical protein
MVAMRSQMFAEHPHLSFTYFFMHFRANDDALTLAGRGRAARANNSGLEGVEIRRRERERPQRLRGVRR